MYCPNCDSDEVQIIAVPMEIELRSGTRVNIPDREVAACQRCGERFIPPELERPNMQRIADARRGAEGKLTGWEIKEIRESTRLSQAEFAKVIGQAANAVGKYERGDVLQSASADLLLRLISEVPSARKYLMALSGFREATNEFVVVREGERTMRGLRVDYVSDAGTRRATAPFDRPPKGLSYG